MKSIKITKDVKDTETGELLTKGNIVERDEKRAEAFVKAGYAQYVKVEMTPRPSTATEAKATTSADDDKPKKVKKTQPSPKVKKKSK